MKAEKGGQAFQSPAPDVLEWGLLGVAGGRNRTPTVLLELELGTPKPVASGRVVGHVLEIAALSVHFRAT